MTRDKEWSRQQYQIQRRQAEININKLKCAASANNNSYNNYYSNDKLRLY